jgi:hypothetical protein
MHARAQQSVDRAMIHEEPRKTRAQRSYAIRHALLIPIRKRLSALLCFRFVLFDQGFENSARVFVRL